MTEGLIKKAGNSSIETRQRVCSWQHTHGCVQSKPGHLSSAPFTSGYTNTLCDQFPIHSHSFLLFLIIFFFVLDAIVSQGKNRWIDKERDGSRGDDNNLCAFKMTYFLLDLSTIIINIFFTSFRNFPPLLLSVAASNWCPSLGSLPFSPTLTHHLSSQRWVILKSQWRVKEAGSETQATWVHCRQRPEGDVCGCTGWPRSLRDFRPNKRLSLIWGYRLSVTQPVHGLTLAQIHRERRTTGMYTEHGHTFCSMTPYTLPVEQLLVRTPHTETNHIFSSTLLSPSLSLRFPTRQRFRIITP